jgi:predicted nuclease of predicted toxin-antitoxin system
MLSLYFDEHMPEPIGQALVRRGIDVLTPQAANRRGYADPGQLAYATEHGRLMVTRDSDYLALHATGVAHAGILFAQSDAPIGILIETLLLAVQVLSAEEMRNGVVYL